jgi:hypothetical protein
MVWRAAAEEEAGLGAKLPGTIETEGEGVFIRTGRRRLRLLDVETGLQRMTGEGIIQYFKDREGTILS